mmetsp:Transcript_23462/g.73794  ORF Transcript_23462/g.73794 Transcript_23462/m.73794 type:complete len:272 (-) Transcript_23462:217-1032(-)
MSFSSPAVFSPPSSSSRSPSSSSSPSSSFSSPATWDLPSSPSAPLAPPSGAAPRCRPSAVPPSSQRSSATVRVATAGPEVCATAGAAPPLGAELVRAELAEPLELLEELPLELLRERLRLLGAAAESVPPARRGAACRTSVPEAGTQPRLLGVAFGRNSCPLWVKRTWSMGMVWRLHHASMSFLKDESAVIVKLSTCKPSSPLAWTSTSTLPPLFPVAAFVFEALPPDFLLPPRAASVSAPSGRSSSMASAAPPRCFRATTCTNNGPANGG